MPGPYRSERLLFEQIRKNGGLSIDQVETVIEQFGLIFYRSIRDTLNMGVRKGEIDFDEEEQIYRNPSIKISL